MPVNNLSLNRSIMVLGEVTINGQQQVVVVYSPKVLHASAFQSRDVCQRLFQKVVQDYDAHGLARVNGAGFEQRGRGVQSHDDRKTTEAWQTFVRALEHPNLASEIREAVDDARSDSYYVGIDPRPIYEAFREHLEDPSNPVVLDDDQKRWLRHFKFRKLAIGEYDFGEYMSLGCAIHRL